MSKKQTKATDETKATELKETTEAIEKAKQPQQALEGIAVCGSHPATIGDAPFDDPAWLIYACSPHNIEHRMLPRVDEWFEVHEPIQDVTRSYHYLRMLEHQGYRVWMKIPPEPPHPDTAKSDKERTQLAHLHEQARLARLNMAWFKEAREYPFNELQSVFGPFFWVGSVAHMIYKAIVDCVGDETFRLFVDMEAAKDGRIEVPDYIREAAERPAPIPKIALYGILQKGKEEYEQQRFSTQYAIWRAAQAGVQMQVSRESELFEPARFTF